MCTFCVLFFLVFGGYVCGLRVYTAPALLSFTFFVLLSGVVACEM